MNESQVVIRPMDWAPLSDVDEVEPFNAKDHECIAELYEVLKRHNKEMRFGVTLIHKHFVVSDDEVLLERCDPETRTLTIRPAKKSSAEVSRSLQTSWILAKNGEREPIAACYRRCERDIHGNHGMGGHYWG